jgi:hypothetical protein
MNVEDPMVLRKMIYDHVRSNIGYTGERETISLEDEPPTTQESWDKLMRLKMISELASASVAAAPAAPPKEAPTKPRPSTPAPKPSPSPWETPWPSTLPMPEPKAKRGKKSREGIKETFERSVDRSTQQFWSGLPRNKQHAFGKHPILAMYGLEKAKRSWQSGVDMLKRLYPNLQNKSNPEVTRAAPELAMDMFNRLKQIERPYHNELAQLAIDLVHQVWGVPKHLMDAKFSSRPGMTHDDDIGGGGGKPKNMGMEYTPPDTQKMESLRDQINKRITMNTLTQGAGVQNMQTIHHLATEQLNRIAPELLLFYSKFSAGALSWYWLINFSDIANLADSAIGDVRLVELPDQNDDEELLDFKQEEESGEQREEKPKSKRVIIQARAMVFPVLVQELVKGAMEYLTTLGMANMDEQDRNIVLAQADKLDYEPWQIQIGPELWNAFLKIVPRGATLANVVHQFAGKDPKFVHKVLADTIEAVHRNEDPLSPRQALAEMMAELESPSTDEEWSEAEDDESWRGDDEYDDDMEDYV